MLQSCVNLECDVTEKQVFWYRQVVDRPTSSTVIQTFCGMFYISVIAANLLQFDSKTFLLSNLSKKFDLYDLISLQFWSKLILFKSPEIDQI